MSNQRTASSQQMVKCPHCELEVRRIEFKKLDNGDPIHNLDSYRCPDCGHIFAPVPEELLPDYHEKVLGIRLLV